MDHWTWHGHLFQIFEEMQVPIGTLYMRCTGHGNALQHSVRHLNVVLAGIFVYNIAIQVCKTDGS
jgi:hypothetical protein